MSIKDPSKVCAVFVTYGDRYHLLEQGIESLLNQQVTNIIVVDNHSAPPSHAKLKNCAKALDGKLEIIHLSHNTGSAGGYNTGLQHARTYEECEFIWLLDDDNKPKEGALKALMDFWQGIQEVDKEHRIALMSFRDDREIYKEVIARNKPDLVIGRKNSALGFHVCEIPSVLLRKINRKRFRKMIATEAFGKKYGPVAAVPYGGMFFHKTLLDDIGYPNRDFFLYSDDWDFSIRITKKEGRIILCLDSLIEDVEKSWHRQHKKSAFKIGLLDELEDFRLYYYVRNRIYFEKRYLVTNPIVYSVNRFILLSLVAIFGLLRKRSNIRIIRKAVRDGDKGRLGEYSL